jgi:hypothetical protein
VARSIELTPGFTLLLLSAATAVAQLMGQSIAIGIEGGLRTTGDVSGTLSPESKRYIVGPKLEVRLPWHLSFEFDALYRDVGFTGYPESPFFSATTRERDSSWEFPLIVKYHFPRLVRLRPFAGIGYAPRIVHGDDVSSGSYLSGMTENPPASVYTYYFNSRSNTSYPATQGLVVSVGVEFGARHVLISAEPRYVHWNQPFLSEFGGDGSFRYTSAERSVCAAGNRMALKAVLF